MSDRKRKGLFLRKLSHKITKEYLKEIIPARSYT